MGLIKKALIVVRTYPVPAKKGVEVSCTAAVTEQGEWLRLFPVPYRREVRHPLLRGHVARLSSDLDYRGTVLSAQVKAVAIPWRLAPTCLGSFLCNRLPLRWTERSRPSLAALGPAELPEGHSRRVLPRVLVGQWGAVQTLPDGLFHYAQGRSGEIVLRSFPSRLA
jgi:hypothetical protein